MASELRVNTLKDASGNNSIATSFVASGSAKCAFKTDGTYTGVATGALNVSGLTDNGTGDITIAFSSSFSSADNTQISGAGDSTAVRVVTYNTEATSSMKFKCSNHSNSATDNEMCGHITGDLA